MILQARPIAQLNLLCRTMDKAKALAQIPFRRIVTNPQQLLVPKLKHLIRSSHSMSSGLRTSFTQTFHHLPYLTSSTSHTRILICRTNGILDHQVFTLHTETKVSYLIQHSPRLHRFFTSELAWPLRPKYLRTHATLVFPASVVRGLPMRKIL